MAATDIFEFFDDGSIEHHLEKMFYVDSFGSSADDNEFICDCDKCRIKEIKVFVYFK